MLSKLGDNLNPVVFAEILEELQDNAPILSTPPSTLSSIKRKLRQEVDDQVEDESMPLNSKKPPPPPIPIKFLSSAHPPSHRQWIIKISTWTWLCHLHTYLHLPFFQWSKNSCSNLYLIINGKSKIICNKILCKNICNLHFISIFYFLKNFMQSGKIKKMRFFDFVIPFKAFRELF